MKVLKVIKRGTEQREKAVSQTERERRDFFSNRERRLFLKQRERRKEV